MKHYLPLALTYINLICGCLIIYMLFVAIHNMGIGPEDIRLYTGLRIIALIADVLDGRVARKLDATSELGMYLDSFADMVTFGVAPGIFVLVYYLSAGALNMDGAEHFPLFFLSSMIYICAGAYRLARFHTLQANTSTVANTHYIGMPITLNGILFPLTLYTLTLVSGDNHLVFLSCMSIYMLVSAYLMASTIRFPKF